MYGAYLLAHWSSSASSSVEGVGVDVEAERLGVTCIRATRKPGRPKKTILRNQPLLSTYH
jgi:hypothetical protein